MPMGLVESPRAETLMGATEPLLPMGLVEWTLMPIGKASHLALR